MATMAAANERREHKKTEIHLTVTYPHPRAKVWRAVTEPEHLAKWLMKPEGLSLEVGAKFRLVAKPQIGWRGYVDCVVLEVVPGYRFAFSWAGDEKTDLAPMTVAFTLEDDGDGTRFTLDHIGFEGLSGWMLARLMMGPGWKKMMTKRLVAVLSGAEG